MNPYRQEFAEVGLMVLATRPENNNFPEKDFIGEVAGHYTAHTKSFPTRREAEIAATELAKTELSLSLSELGQ